MSSANHSQCTERMSGGFTIFHFTRFERKDTCTFIGVSSWLFLSGQNFEIRLLKFSCLGYPPGIEKNFFSFFDTFYLQSDRARRADQEYGIFIEIWSENKKNVTTVFIKILIGF